MTDTALANRIRGERINLNLTQRELGEKLNVPPKRVGRWERSVSPPTVKEALAMCDIFGCTVEYLYCQTDTRR